MFQHITSKHAEEHKRNIDTSVEVDRLAGVGLMESLNVVYGGIAVDKYVEWVALDTQSLDMCESSHFREMVAALNQKSKLATLSRNTVREQVTNILYMHIYVHT